MQSVFVLIRLLHSLTYLGACGLVKQKKCSGKAHEFRGHGRLWTHALADVAAAGLHGKPSLAESLGRSRLWAVKVGPGFVLSSVLRFLCSK